MRAPVFLLVLLLVVACGRYESNDVVLLTSHAAKEMCSCTFVMNQPEDFCIAWVKAAPDVKTLTVDRGKKRVDAESLTLWGARARYLDKRRGCTLE